MKNSFPLTCFTSSYFKMIIETMDFHNNDKFPIENYCREVRNAIIKIKNDSQLFKKFPLGCCRDSSIIIGELLIGKGLNNIYLCRKEIDGIYPSHAWLEYNDWLIDITADQFGVEFSPVIVLQLESIYWFHKKCDRQLVSFSLAGTDKIDLYNDYELIKNEIDPFVDKIIFI